MQRFPAHLTSTNPVVHLLTPIVAVFTSLVVELLLLYHFFANQVL